MSLPPPPPTTSVRSQQRPSQSQQPLVDLLASFDTLRSSYINMLGSSTISQDDTLGLATPALDQGSVDFTFGDDFLNTNASLDAFLTSPLFEDSPLEGDTPLVTPGYALTGGARSDVNSSPPLFGDVLDDNFDFPLFGSTVPSVTESTRVLGLMAMTPDSPSKHSFDDQPPSPTSPFLYTMATPALPPVNLFNSPSRPPAPFPTPDVTADASASCAAAKSRAATAGRSVPKAVHTGHRKNLPLSALVPLDAPTQPRNYLTPSQTSRKEMPPSLIGKRAIATRKRSRAQAELDDEDDEDDGVDESLLTEVELKRRQNTIAARKSRMRKKHHVIALESEVADLVEERDMLMARTEMLEERLRQAGLPID